FFQAEDGIRDGHVTGVQTCALPIYVRRRAGDGGGGDRFDGAVAVFRVILRDVDERDGGGDPDHPAQREVPPRGREGGRVEQPVGAAHEARGGEHRGPHVPAVERVHRVLVFTGFHQQHTD